MLTLLQNAALLPSDALLVQLGRRTFSLSLDQVKSPEEVRPVSIEPAQVKLSIMQD